MINDMKWENVAKKQVEKRDIFPVSSSNMSEMKTNTVGKNKCYI